MKCWNCHHEMPNEAKACQFCEVPVEQPPSEEELAAIRDMMARMPPEALAELSQTFSASQTSDEFVNLVMVGLCPVCGSAETGDCENDPDIDNLLVARCYQCGRLWCANCGKLMTKDKNECECWDDEE